MRAKQHRLARPAGTVGPGDEPRGLPQTGRTTFPSSSVPALIRPGNLPRLAANVRGWKQKSLAPNAVHSSLVAASKRTWCDPSQAQLSSSGQCRWRDRRDGWCPNRFWGSPQWSVVTASSPGGHSETQCCQAGHHNRQKAQGRRLRGGRGLTAQLNGGVSTSAQEADVSTALICSCIKFNS